MKSETLELPPVEETTRTPPRLDGPVPDAQRATTRRQIKRRRSRQGFLFVLPATIFIFTFMLFPLLYSGYMSLTEYNFVYDDAPTFVGLRNYFDALQDPLVMTSLRNTATFGFIYFIIAMVLSLTLALLLFQKVRFNAFFRSAIFVPIVVPLSLAALVFVWILQPEFGLLNYLLREVFATPSLARAWLTEGPTAMASLIVVAVWATTGFLTILFLAGLQGIPSDILEAAEVDGASGLRKIFLIILPNLRETYIVTGAWAIIHGLKVFVEPMVMTEGGPGTSTLVLYQHLYQTAFSYFDMGYASAMAYILGFIILGLVGLNFMVGRNRND